MGKRTANCRGKTKNKSTANRISNLQMAKLRANKPETKKAINEEIKDLRLAKKYRSK